MTKEVQRCHIHNIWTNITIKKKSSGRGYYWRHKKIDYITVRLALSMYMTHLCLCMQQTFRALTKLTCRWHLSQAKVIR